MGARDGRDTPVLSLSPLVLGRRQGTHALDGCRCPGRAVTVRGLVAAQADPGLLELRGDVLDQIVLVHFLACLILAEVDQLGEGLIGLVLFCLAYLFSHLMAVAVGILETRIVLDVSVGLGCERVSRPRLLLCRPRDDGLQRLGETGVPPVSSVARLRRQPSLAPLRRKLFGSATFLFRTGHQASAFDSPRLEAAHHALALRLVGNPLLPGELSSRVLLQIVQVCPGVLVLIMLFVVEKADIAFG